MMVRTTARFETSTREASRPKYGAPARALAAIRRDGSGGLVKAYGPSMRIAIRSDVNAQQERSDHLSEVRQIRVLFICTGNSARSQVAEALLRFMGGEDFEVASAGTHPRGVNPLAIRVLAEAGIDWSGARSKAVAEFLDQHFDHVITVCDRARETCPVFPGSGNTLHWGLDDPAEVKGPEAERLAAFRRTRRELTLRLRPFVEIARRGADSGAGALSPARG